MLILVLSFPALAGHTTTGYGWCNCNPVQGVCPCCGGIFNIASSDQQDEKPVQKAPDGVEPASELGLVLLAFLLWLKLRA
jgi:hypothetical protein